jgi:hypothetical protein
MKNPNSLIKKYLIETYKNDPLIKGFRVKKNSYRGTSVYIQFDLDYMLYKETRVHWTLSREIEKEIIAFMVANNINVPYWWNEDGQKVEAVCVEFRNC